MINKEHGNLYIYFAKILSLPILFVFLPIKIIIIYFNYMKNHFFKWFLMNTMLVIILCFLLFHYIINSIPDIDTMLKYKPTLTTKFFDRNNNLIYELGNEKRTFIAIEKVPKQFINAFIAAEDKTFYTNPGIDIIGIIKIIILDCYKVFKHEKLAGGSTITQQIVKNILLTNERTVIRKLKEAILSYQLTQTMSKDKILELYLNHIFLGMQSYGIVVAANEYFGKNLDQLNVSEMALLAALPKAPSALNPFKNKIRALSRRNWVLKRMLEENYITDEQYNEAINMDIILKKYDKDNNFLYAPSFFAKNILLKSNLNLTENSLLNNGYNVKLSIDKEIQRIAQKTLDKWLINYSKKHGFVGAINKLNINKEDDINIWKDLIGTIEEPDNIGNFLIAAVIDVEDSFVTIGLKDGSEGRILLKDMLWARQKISETQINHEVTKCSNVLKIGDVIVVNNKDNQSQENKNNINNIEKNDKTYYTLEQIPEINGAIVGLNPKNGEILTMVGGYLDIPGSFNRAFQANRQIGSAIKPFIYSIALDNGISIADIFMDEDMSFNLGNGVLWSPKNYTKTTSGPVTLRTGFEQSKNTVTIRVADRIGIYKIKDYLIKYGLNNNPEANLSTAIGSMESSPLSVARATTTFINDGKICNIAIINSITDSVNNNISDKIEFTTPDFNIVNKDTNIKNNNDIQNDSIDNDNDKESILNKDENFIISPQTASQVISLMEGSVKRGTSSELITLNIPIAAKTGTSDKGRDLWTIAITPEIVLVVYIGYDIPIDTNHYGSQFALPIIKEILTELKNKIEFSHFKIPDNITNVKINRLNGKRTTKSIGKEVMYEMFKESDPLPKFDENEIDGKKMYDVYDIE